MIYMDKVEEYYAKKHAKGRALKSVVDNPAYGALYQFEKCEPAEYYYKVEYCEAEELEAYTALLTDCGWEYVCALHHCKLHIFRKPSDGCIDSGLFDTDNEPKAREYEKIIKLHAGWQKSYGFLMICMSAVAILAIIADFISEGARNTDPPYYFLPFIFVWNFTWNTQRGVMRRLKKSVAMLRGTASADKPRRIVINKQVKG